MESLPPGIGKPVDSGNSPEMNFLLRTCIPYLRDAQNEDGGWGYQRGSQSRVEPTAWAMLALRASGSVSGEDRGLDQGTRFLKNSQLADGSWPASPESSEGCWVTSLACWALLRGEDAAEGVARGVAWLATDRPGESRLWWRMLRRMSSDRKISSRNTKLYGWSWTAQTSSWVEPTSVAVSLLRQIPSNLLTSEILRRRQMADAMIFDRMCAGGGWNCGNPMDYGVPGEPQISSTVFALLALRENRERSEIQASLAWLEANWERSQTPASLALAHLALRAYGRSCDSVGESLRAAYDRDAESWGVLEMAWTALAFSASDSWLNSAADGESR